VDLLCTFHFARHGDFGFVASFKETRVNMMLKRDYATINTGLARLDHNVGKRTFDDETCVESLQKSMLSSLVQAAAKHTRFHSITNSPQRIQTSVGIFPTSWLTRTCRNYSTCMKSQNAYNLSGGDIDFTNVRDPWNKWFLLELITTSFENQDAFGSQRLYL
jgi:hypothetical protein